MNAARRRPAGGQLASLFVSGVWQSQFFLRESFALGLDRPMMSDIPVSTQIANPQPELISSSNGLNFSFRINAK
jgi:hypothetical protein